ncbi:MAG: transcriptional regulator, TetR family [Pseudonocardiales bacterium]|nr:transcriptional regulator, TetR family [Pseudonocardiales bacterium]
MIQPATVPDPLMTSQDTAALRVDEERTRVLRAARRLIGQRDGRVTTVAEVLQEAGVNRRIFYRHFQSKDDLILAMVEQAGATLQAGLETAVRESKDPPSAVAAYIHHLLGVGWDERRAHDGRAFLSLEVTTTAGTRAAIEGVYAAHRAIIHAVLAAGRADASLPGAVPDRDSFALHAVLIRHIEVSALAGYDRDFETVRDGVTQLFLTAFGARPYESPPPAHPGRCPIT